MRPSVFQSKLLLNWKYDFMMQHVRSLIIVMTESFSSKFQIGRQKGMCNIDIVFHRHFGK